MHVFLACFTLFCVIFLIVASYVSKLQAKESELLALKNSCKNQELYIEKLQTEKKQMVGLVETQNVELVEKLRAIENQSKEVRQIVGLQSQSASTVTKRRTIKANRGVMPYHTIKNELNELHKKISISADEVDTIEKKAQDYKKEKVRLAQIYESIPSIWPAVGQISSDYGFRIHPVYGYTKYHSGIDIAYDYGSPIYATASGYVSETGYSGGYGNMVKLDHGNGIETLYGHCSYAAVTKGQYVRKGSVIAYMGSTGVSTGPHVHYEVIVHGAQVDPFPYLECSQQRLLSLRGQLGL